MKIKGYIPSEKEMNETARKNLAKIKNNLVNNLPLTSFTEKAIRIAKQDGLVADHKEPCEKCNKATWFTVQVMDKTSFWCGCMKSDTPR